MKTLIIVDLQNDFMPGGALGVPEADLVIPIVNKIMPHFSLILATQDWHPSDHVSFATNHPGKKPGDVVEVKGISQILWPVHCVRNSKGAELVKELKKEKIESIFYKGTDKEIDSYSAFFDNAHLKSTGLHEYLSSRGINEITIAGVATDYCVLYSVLDAIELGLSVTVISDACKGINLYPGDVESAFAKMMGRGAKVITSAEL
jgi:nicotinamidase/pyrazinamidase